MIPINHSIIYQINWHNLLQRILFQITWLSKRNGGTLCCLLSKLSKLASRGLLFRVESRSKDIDRFDTVLRLLSL